MFSKMYNIYVNVLLLWLNKNKYLSRYKYISPSDINKLKHSFINLLRVVTYLPSSCEWWAYDCSPLTYPPPPSPLGYLHQYANTCKQCDRLTGHHSTCLELYAVVTFVQWVVFYLLTMLTEEYFINWNLVTFYNSLFK